MLHECLLSPEISTAYLSEVGHMSGRPLAIYSVAKGVFCLKMVIPFQTPSCLLYLFWNLKRQLLKPSFSIWLGNFFVSTAFVIRSGQKSGSTSLSGTKWSRVTSHYQIQTISIDHQPSEQHAMQCCLEEASSTNSLLYLMT